MKRYTAAQARQQFADLLDAAERGRPVVIERRGVRFLVHAQPRGRHRRPARRKSIFESVDRAVAAGEWTWSWKAEGVSFEPRAGKR
jgi:antitoxin (DNA-binding transcriptional repressor) of toxin-antitoxin stability system